MTIFVMFCLMFVGFYLLRYIWVHIQCRRAIGYATHLSVSHIEKCKEAFATVRESHIMDEQKYHLHGVIRRCLNKANDYWKDYEKDFDFNKLWMACDKWTLKQMFPTLTNNKGLEVVWE